MEKLKVGVIGASGYAGAELIRLLLAHPGAELAGIHARSYPGQPVKKLYPGLNGATELVFEEEDAVIAKSSLIFASLPHGLSENIARKCLQQGKRLIDLGADFRLKKEEDYREWYHLEYKEKALHEKSVYGLCELHRESIKKAEIIGNPGCYPTSIALGCYPALKAELVSVGHLIIDSKSGATGAGKEPKDNTHFPRTNEAFAPYGIGTHRHTPEIEQMLSEAVEGEVKVTFVPHLLPVNRGIISTMYLPLIKAVSLEEIHKLYEDFYRDEKFIRLLDIGETADLKFVKYSNFCDISLHMDERNKTLVVVSCIDNMVKGAAGQAVQNMNLMYGFPEDMGLTFIPPSF